MALVATHLGALRQASAPATLTLPHASAFARLLAGLRGAIPALIHISDGKLHDMNVLDMLVFEPGAFYVMDRGYVDFERLHAIQRAGAFIVTRAKSPMDASRVYSASTERSTAVISDLSCPPNFVFQGPMVSIDTGRTTSDEDTEAVHHSQVQPRSQAGGASRTVLHKMALPVLMAH